MQANTTSTRFAVEWGGEIVAIFKSDFCAVQYAQEVMGKGAIVHKWTVPSDLFEFEE